MMSWWKISGLALLASGLSVACTITSGDDDDSGGTSSYTGGAASTTGGSGGAAGGATSAGGQTTSTGGTTQLGVCTGNATTKAACDTCLTTNCSTDFSACGDLCKTEFNIVRNCAIADTSSTTNDVKAQGCTGDVCTDDPSAATLAVLDCALSQTASVNCETDCF